MPFDTVIFAKAAQCKCPACGEGALYKAGFMNMALREECSVCGLDFSKGDSADGPAVFLIFVLGAALVPLALLLEFTLSPPLWFHAVLWGALTILITLGLLRPLKAYVIALQYKHRPEMFG